MPRLKSETIVIGLGDGLGSPSCDVTYHVNVAGEFYCQVPDELLEFFDYGNSANGVICRKNQKRKLAIYSDSLSKLKSALMGAMRAVYRPIVTETHVIRYNIQSDVSFAETSTGEIVPNASYPNAIRWEDAVGSKALMYGEHHATKPCSGGYSLKIGAMAMTKTVRKLGSKETVTYARYYQDGSHLGRDNPAQILNSWSSFTLPNDVKEIPYTDEAAMFFHRLMMGMAKISRQIQEATFEQESLLALIESKTNLLGFSVGDKSNG